MTLAVAARDPEAINRRFMESARIGPLLIVSIIFFIAAALYIYYYGHAHRPTQEDAQWIWFLMLGALDFGAVLFARAVFLPAVLGTLATSQMLRLSVAVGAATGLLTASMVTYTHFPSGARPFQLFWIPIIILRSAAIVLILFSWIQTRIGTWLTPFSAACIVAVLFALFVWLEHRSWVIVASDAGYYSLPFIRWKTGSLGACLISLLFAGFLTLAVVN